MARGFVNRGRPALRQGQRRQTIWFADVVLETAVAGGGGAVFISSLNAAALARRPFTVIRARGVLAMQSDQTAATESQLAGFGAAVVSEEAVTVGITAMPTPITEADSGLFFVYEIMLQELQVTSAAGSGGVGKMGVERIVDSRAMRKVDLGQDIVFVADTAGLSDGVVIRTFVRLLIKLH